MDGLAGHGLEQPQVRRVEAWEQFSWLRAGFSERQGGASAVYGAPGELNLGWTKEDDPQTVAANRAQFVQTVTQGAPMQLVTVGQVHGAVVRDLEQESGPLMTEAGRAALEGDGMICKTPGRLLATLTADCVPVLVADTRTHAVGAFHAGWRGTRAGIVGQGVQAMCERYGSRPADLVAAIGPCIRACCFEVGEEVQSAFEAEFRYAATLFTRPQGDGTLHLDLQESNRRQLVDAGLAAQHISVLAECTACSRLDDGRRRFFSYRAEAGNTGRMLSAIGAVL